MSRHFNDKLVFGRSQHGFAKHRSCQTNLIAFYDEMKVSVEKEREVDTVYFDFSQTSELNIHLALSLVPHQRGMAWTGGLRSVKLAELLS